MTTRHTVAHPKRSTAAGLAVCTLACAAALTLASCDDDDDEGGNRTVHVSLREFSVTPDRGSVQAGVVTFDVTNDGEEDHEFLVIRTNLAPDALPTEEDGSYEEDGPGTELLEEIELIEPGATERLMLELGAGNYVLICNMVEMEDDEVEAHYSLGMHTAFTVQ